MARHAPPADSEDEGTTRSDTALSLGRSLALFGLGFFVSFLPQMIFWRVVNGGWLALPHGQAGQQWWSDSLMVHVLFSSNHGLLAWHPIIYLAVLGIPLFLLRDFRLGGLLTLVFLIQIYINGAVATWWGGHAFGGRRFASCALLFALGLAAFIRFLQKRPLTGIVGTLSILVVLNAFFIGDIKAGRLPTGQGITFNDIVGASYRQLGNPFSFPANALFGRRQGMTALQYDELGLRLYNNLHIDLGEEGDERYLGRGWSSSEQGERGSFRWALGPESVVIAPLKAPEFLRPGEVQSQPDYVLRFRAYPYRVDDGRVQTIEFWVNGELAGRQPLRRDLRQYEVDIPGRAVQRNLNEIVMRYSYWRPDPGVGSTAERRPLAVRFDRIDLIRQPVSRLPQGGPDAQNHP